MLKKNEMEINNNSVYKQGIAAREITSFLHFFVFCFVQVKFRMKPKSQRKKERKNFKKIITQRKEKFKYGKKKERRKTKGSRKG